MIKLSSSGWRILEVQLWSREQHWIDLTVWHISGHWRSTVLGRYTSRRWFVCNLCHFNCCQCCPQIHWRFQGSCVKRRGYIHFCCYCESRRILQLCRVSASETFSFTCTPCMPKLVIRSDKPGSWYLLFKLCSGTWITISSVWLTVSMRRFSPQVEYNTMVNRLVWLLQIQRCSLGSLVSLFLCFDYRRCN